MKRVTRNDNPFELTDYIIEHYLRLIVRRFRRLLRELTVRKSGGTILAIDAINSLNQITACYDDSREYCLQALRLIALRIYKRYNGDDEDFPIDMWFAEYMGKYDALTHYIFNTELNNKRLRLLEAVVLAGKEASPTDAVKKSVEKALHYLSKQFRQFGDDITLAAINQVYTDNGIEMVEWVTQRDDRVCPECHALDGVLFPVDNIPPPRHYNCRCFWIPAGAKKS